MLSYVFCVSLMSCCLVYVTHTASRLTISFLVAQTCPDALLAAIPRDIADEHVRQEEAEADPERSHRRRTATLGGCCMSLDGPEAHSSAYEAGCRTSGHRLLQTRVSRTALFTCAAGVAGGARVSRARRKRRAERLSTPCVSRLALVEELLRGFGREVGAGCLRGMEGGRWLSVWINAAHVRDRCCKTHFTEPSEQCACMRQYHASIDYKLPLQTLSSYQLNHAWPQGRAAWEAHVQTRPANAVAPRQNQPIPAARQGCW